MPEASADSSCIDDIINYDGEEDDQGNNSESGDILREVNQANNTRKRKKSKLIPEWIQKHSIIGLTNMIPNLREFGSAWVIWEGSAKGDGILKEVKPLVERNTPNFRPNAHRKFNKRKGLNYVMSTCETSKKRRIHANSEIELDNIRIYAMETIKESPTAKTIKESLTAKTVLSLVRLSDNRFMFITDWRKGEGQVFIRHQYFGQCSGADYFQWKLADGIHDFKTTDITHYCLFLPW
eukprot:scaffold39959_cov64-Attheya_sp.AAC.3